MSGDLDDLFGNKDHPLHWQGRHVYIRSINACGFVSSSRQNGKPSEAIITVTLLEENGYWRDDGIKHNYTMSRAEHDLVPDIRCLIEEEPA